MSQLASSQVSLHAPLFSVYPALHVVHVFAEEQVSQLASSQVSLHALFPSTSYPVLHIVHTLADEQVLQLAVRSSWYRGGEGIAVSGFKIQNVKIHKKKSIWCYNDVPSAQISRH